MSKILITADWHIRSDQPLCRKDDFQETQRNSLEGIRKIYKENDCDTVIAAGDIFDKSRPEKSQELEILLASVFQDVNVVFIPGNHELLWHRFENYGKSVIGVIGHFPNFNLIPFEGMEISGLKVFGFPFGVEAEGSGDCCVLHKFVSENNMPFFIRNGEESKNLLKKLDYNLIITGDNHKAFDRVGRDKKILINPGCINRQSVNEKDYEPGVYIFDTENFNFHRELLPDQEKDVIDTSHIVDSLYSDERDERINNFVDKFFKESDIEKSFEQNLKNYISKNKVSSRVEEKIMMALEGEVE